MPAREYTSGVTVAVAIVVALSVETILGCCSNSGSFRSRTDGRSRRSPKRSYEGRHVYLTTMTDHGQRVAVRYESLLGQERAAEGRTDAEC